MVITMGAENSSAQFAGGMCAFAQNLTVPRAVCLRTPFTALQVLKLFVT